MGTGPTSLLVLPGHMGLEEGHLTAVLVRVSDACLVYRQRASRMFSCFPTFLSKRQLQAGGLNGNASLQIESPSESGLEVFF